MLRASHVLACFLVAAPLANRALIARLRPVVARYANIGIRIEDDYFVTPSGVEWISRAPREADEIEQMMRTRAAAPASR